MPIKPTFSLSQIITQLTTSWGGAQTGDTYTWRNGGGLPDGVGDTITYSLPGSAPTNAGSVPSEAAGMTALSTLAKAGAQLAFELWDDLITPHITESVTDSPAAQITFAHSSTTDQDGTYTISYGNQAGSDFHLTAGQVWIASDWFTDADLSPTQYGLLTFEHEIGHALGLSHPGTYDASQGTVTYVNDAVFAQDNRQYSIMSYFGGYQPGSGWQQDGTYSNWYYADTPMVYDIAAIQAKYGADYTTRAGNTVYGFNSSFLASDPEASIYDFSRNPHPILTIWDGGGTDTLDGSGYAGPQVINLSPGQYSSMDGLVNNIGIAFGTIIENAKGGAGADVLSGNATDNRLDGGGGNDILIGGMGHDVLVGGTGADLFTFDNSVLSNVAAGTYNEILDYNQSAGGAVNSGEGDRIDISSFVSAYYLHGNGAPVSSLVQVLEDPSGTFSSLLVNERLFGGGTGWANFARLDGVQLSDHITLVVDGSQPTGVSVQPIASVSAVAPVVSLPAPTAPVSSGAGAVYRFFDTVTHDHFYTTDPIEKANIQAHLPAFRYEGSSWATPDKGADTVDVFRFFDSATGTHHFTTSTAERDWIESTLPTFRYEGVAFEAYQNAGPGEITLERFYNTDSHVHHFAASAQESGDIRAGLAGHGWVDEGPGFIVHNPVTGFFV